MHFIERIGPALGIAAFFGLVVLVFLLFQQARDIRRLREWAGRAPERAQEAVDASQAAAEAKGEEGEAAATPGLRARLAAVWQRGKGAVGPRAAEFDRRLPVPAPYILGAAALVIAVAAVLTSGFGLLGGGTQSKPKVQHESHPVVAVLNGTAVSGLAAKAEAQAVEPAGYHKGPVTNTESSFQSTVVMYAPGHADEAKALATAIQPKLGDTPTQRMSEEISSLAGKAPLALVIGSDDARF
jgi:hypothetical protein